ncbi:MAG: type III-B CRISPR module-associated Cmr3 family protein [Bacillota bacterium]|jgi:CRISPR-associated protein Cmr3|nr:type III-B CRISPR module-associated Cmr3 family protein [Bacillota bacterium]
MTVTLWKFTALDTFFFRGAAPFNAGEGGQGGQASMFPPTMSTLQGAIRYQLAIGQGWQPNSALPIELGDSDDLGQLRLRGPYLFYNDDLLLPCPLLVIRRLQGHGMTTQVNYHRLAPGQKTVKCDLGTVNLPVMPPGLKGAKPMENYWLNTAAMNRVLAGGVPEARGAEPNYSGIYDNDQLWKTEPKVGIGRDSGTRTAQDKNLYAIKMIRPEKGLSIAVSVEGLGNEWIKPLKSKPRLVNLGGEGKLASLEILKQFIRLPDLPELAIDKGKVRFTVSLITPGYFGNREETIDAVSGLKEWIKGECITACVGKAIQVGGWDLAKHQPRPLKSYIPPGSTWFFEGDASQVDSIKEMHGSLIGKEESHPYGCGQILIGSWR